MEQATVPRLLRPPERSFFLFGPRGVGKSTWLRANLPEASYVDLLDSRVYLELSRSPAALEALLGDRPRQAWAILDEIQKVPELLDEVHRLIESHRWRFVLCGSSARKLKRRGTNLLGGRAVTRRLEGFCSAELSVTFDLQASLEWGTLPWVHFDPGNAADILSSYVQTYIKEEIREESIVRSVPPFVRFLAVAGQLNAQVLNLQNIAREAAIPRSTVDVYFSILEDTLLGHYLPAYLPNLKVRERGTPKFYWFDAGVARAAAGLLFEPADRFWQGTALETLIYHELRVYNHVTGRNRPIAFYRLPSGAEIDFVIETRKRTAESPARVVCIEVKLSRGWERKWERPMRSMAEGGGIRVDRMIGVYMGDRSYRYDGLEVLPVRRFLELLHSGAIF